MYIGTLKGVGKVYLHACVDTYGSYAFGFLHTGKKPECAAALLHNDVPPFYREHGLTVGAVLTDNGREFCGTENHPYELYLALNDIEHRRTKVKSPKTNGFIERFNKTVLDEFFRIAFRENFYESVEALQEDLTGGLSTTMLRGLTEATETAESAPLTPSLSMFHLSDMSISCTFSTRPSILPAPPARPRIPVRSTPAFFSISSG